MSENDIIIEDEGQAPLREKPAKKTVKQQEVVIPPKPEKQQSEKHFFLHDSVGISYETSGRFEISDRLDFGNYDLGHIHKLAVSRREDRVPHLVDILNSLMHESNGENDSVENMLLEEFFETLVAIAYKFQGKDHIHRWICQECQKDKEDDDKVSSEQIVDLGTLKYISIYQADEIAREEVRKKLEKIDEPTFRKFLKNKYGTNDEKANWTKEQFVKDQEIKDGFTHTGLNGKQYEFEFAKVRHLLRAKEIAEKEYEIALKQMKKEKFDGTQSLADYKYRQEVNMRKLREAQAEKVMLCHRALTLKKVNGKELETDYEKIEAFKAIDPADAVQISSFLNKIKFGIVDERDYVCNLCGYTERGFLHQRTSPLEFLPESTDTSRELRESSKEITFTVF